MLVIVKNEKESKQHRRVDSSCHSACRLLTVKENGNHYGSFTFSRFTFEYKSIKFHLQNAVDK